MRSRGSAGILDWAVAGQALRGQLVSGDAHLVAPFGGGVLVAVVDGLGHGRDAEIAARAAVDAMRVAPEEPVAAQIARCHGALQRLRGAVMSVASFDAARATMTWIGVGNVEGVLLRVDPTALRTPRERLLVWGGVVGQTLPSLRPTTLPVVPGDTLVFATDGVRTAFADDLRAATPADAIADDVFARHATGNDDALVLAARVRPGAP